MFDAGVGTVTLGGPIIEMELALGAGVNTGADLWPEASTRLVVLLTAVLTAELVVAFNKVGTGGG